MLTLKINGLTELQRKFAIDPKTKITDALEAVGKIVKRELETYPPPNAGNAPKSYQRGRWNTWYERGYGTRWVTSRGQVMGRRTSENLGKQWTLTASGLTATISNGASYAGWVHKTGKQTGFHAAHGWMTEINAATKALNSAEAEAALNKIVDDYK